MAFILKFMFCCIPFHAISTDHPDEEFKAQLTYSLPIARYEAKRFDAINYFGDFSRKVAEVSIRNIRQFGEAQNVHKNGFEFGSFRGDTNVMDALQNWTISGQKRNFSHALTVYEAVAEWLRSTSWFAELGAPRLSIKCFGFKLRKVSAADSSQALYSVHIDFANNQQIYEFIKENKKSREFNQFMELNTSAIHVVDTVNVWMPLSMVTGSPLTVMDIRSLNSSDVRVIQFSYGIGARLLHNKDHRWWWQPVMDFGDFIMFSTTKTFHTAFRLHPDQNRRSIEVRCSAIDVNQELHYEHVQRQAVPPRDYWRELKETQRREDEKHRQKIRDNVQEAERKAREEIHSKKVSEERMIEYASKKQPEQRTQSQPKRDRRPRHN